MARFSVLLVEPNRQQRELLSKQLSFRFQVIVANDLTSAQTLFLEQKPMAVVAGLKQEGSTHGLQFCKMLRDFAHGEQCLLVVHGHPGGVGTPNREALQKKWRTDIYLPTATPDALESLVWHELSTRDREKRAADPARTTGTQSTQPNTQARKPEPATGWQKLLKTEINLQSIKAALQKEI